MADAQKGTFSVASTVEDPMTAESLVELLQDKSIDAFIRARGGGGADTLGAATTAGFGYYEIMVPTPSVEEATRLIDAELAEVEAGAEANARAAEEEALSGETKLPE
jgi:hypothetical protein